MMQQQCPNCAATMELFINQDNSRFFKCPYCGNILSIQISQRPQTNIDKLISFASEFLPNNTNKNVEKEKLISIINDPSSTKEAIKYAKKELKRLNNERSGRY